MYILKYKNKDSFGLNESQSERPTYINGLGMPIDMDEIDLVIEAVKQDLQANFPSVETVLKHKDIIYTDNPHVDTMATDGISIFINPAFVEFLLHGLPNSEDKGALYVEFVFIHECLHVLFDHCFKHKETLDKYADFLRVNKAQDYEINYIIENFLSQGVNDKPFLGVTSDIGGCIDNSFGKRGLTWEEIYNEIPSEKREKSKRQTSDEWKQGFSDGYKDALNDLRKQNLIERCLI